MKYKILFIEEDWEEKPGKENFAYKAGDIINVREEDYKFSGTEGPPIFGVAVFPGNAEDHVYMEAHQLTDTLIPNSAKRIPRLRKDLVKDGRRDTISRSLWFYNSITQQIEKKNAI